MQLSFETTWIDPDDHTLQIWFSAETPIHKTGLEFYNTDNFLREFGEELLKFPFENKNSVAYEYGNWSNSGAHIKITVALKDPAGTCLISVLTEDSEAQAKAEFGAEVQISDLQELSRLMIEHNFNILGNPLIWDAKI